MNVTELTLETVLANTPSDIDITTIFTKKEKGMVDVNVTVRAVNPCEHDGDEWVSQRSTTVDWDTLPVDILQELITENRIIKTRKVSKCGV